MAGLEISAALVGRKVCNPARPEWGVGTVLRVQTTTTGGRTSHRISVQFAAGHRQLLVPPARLAEPEPELERTAGWLDQIGGRGPDDLLVELPEDIVNFLGTPAQRIAVLAPLYEWTDDPAAVSRWARRQANVADPLTHWSRDELLVAFRKFCENRDTQLRKLAALLLQKEGRAALDAVLAALPDTARPGVRAALERPI